MGEWADFWTSIDRMRRDHDDTKAKINRRPGWKFLGCEVFGIRTRWRAEFKESALDAPETLELPTSKELVLEIAKRDSLCPKCFHKLVRCGEKGCTVKDCECEANKKAAA